MQIRNFQTTRQFAENKLQKLNLFETSRFFCDVYCLEPGQLQKPHSHAQNDKLYAVLEGRAVVQVGEEETELCAGEMVLCPADETHGVCNRSEGRAALLVFMAPHPRPAG